ncbi:helix-turn-helix transcriptional regulator [Methylobacterium sp. WSM2598]|uniref:helix-turn-helix transcriptional regulator n=1 Tax=Methylobacterium sp. WSM2598 TaxID=398261 RepID=UPI000372E34E|nr:LuxR C-terminal-related transcriptional regulator [Methylobacterium sp. WSM2598]
MDQETRSVIGLHFDCDISGRDAIKQLLSRGKTRVQLESESWVLIDRPGQRPLIMHATPVPVLGEDGPHSVLILVDLDDSTRPSTAALERIFGLTPAEARLAVKLTRGDTLAEIAEQHGLSVHTVRTQLAAVFSKTNTSRQAELVALALRLSILP